MQKNAKTLIKIVVAALTVTGFAGAGLFAAASRLARLTVRRVRVPKPEAWVVRHDVENSQITLRGADVALPGCGYGFFYGDNRLLRLGEIVSEALPVKGFPGFLRIFRNVVRRKVARDGRPLPACSRQVTRQVANDTPVVLPDGLGGQVKGWWFEDVKMLGLPVAPTHYESALGRCPAWFIGPAAAPGRAALLRGGRLAIHVHGRGALPVETLRGVRVFARQGVTSLVISYRGDPGAPSPVADGYGLGAAESADVAAAIEFARELGVCRVTLVGWSMGGTAALLAAESLRHADVLDGLVLDSPAVDWVGLLEHHAALAGAPRVVSRLGIGLLGSGFLKGGVPGGIPFERLVPESFAERLRIPALIHVGAADSFVPAAGALRLAELSSLVNLRLVADAEHVKVWNADPAAWEDATASFIAGLAAGNCENTVV